MLCLVPIIIKPLKVRLSKITKMPFCNVKNTYDDKFNKIAPLLMDMGAVGRLLDTTERQRRSLQHYD